ncbi:hypothetical protein GEMRC1_001840 [Eukaryota sp. GEM-RC1]
MTTTTTLRDRCLALPSLTAPFNKTREEAMLFRAGQDSTIPSVVANTRIIDSGDAPPAFIHPTSTTFPCCKELAIQACFPLGFIWTPLPSSCSSPVTLQGVPSRCRRCRGYLSPHAANQGRSWICRICGCDNKSEASNFFAQELDEKAMKHGVVDCFLDLSETDFEFYSPVKGLPAADGTHFPLTESFLFVLDGSHSAVKGDVLTCSCMALKELIGNLPDSARVGILVMTSAELYLIDLVSSPNKPSLVIMPDILDPFLPIPPAFLLPLLSDSISTLLDLLDDLPSLIPSPASHLTGAALGSAMVLASQLYSSSAGRVVALTSSIPNVGVGAFMARGTAALGSEKGKQLVLPANGQWNDIVAALNQSNVIVDLIGITKEGNHNLDFATVSLLPNQTGGRLVKIKTSQSSTDCLTSLLYSNLSKLCLRDVVFNAILRVRAGGHFEIKKIHFGNSKPLSHAEVRTPTLASDTTLVVELDIDHKMTDAELVPIQCAMLFTNSCGDRQIRIATASVTVSSTLPPVFRYSSAEAIAVLFSRSLSANVLSKPLTGIREEFVTKSIHLLTSYRLYASQRPHLPQLLLPETLQYFPILLSSLLRSCLLSESGDICLDDRFMFLNLLKFSSVFDFILGLHPFVFDLTGLTGFANNLAGEPILPRLVRPTQHAFESTKVLLIVTHSGAFLFVGDDVDDQQKSRITVADDHVAFSEDWLSNYVNYCIHHVCKSYVPIMYIGDPLHCNSVGKNAILLKELLVEDSIGSNMGLLDFLTNLHHKIVERVNELKHK